MNAFLRLLLGTWAVILPGIVLRAADEPEPGRLKGRVLLLENERVLEGDIERVGERYLIRRSLGESWVTDEKILCLCNDLQEAYQFLRGQANLRDADERLRLARWCQQHRLWEHGLAEATAALELRPKSGEGQRLLQSLQRAASAAATSQAAVKKTEDPPCPILKVDLTLETTIKFSRRVQPILMNTCADCHMTSRGGAFKLVRTYEDGGINSRSLQQNLAAVLTQIKPNHWQKSPLLIKAVSVHGDTGQPPLKSRQTLAYKTIEEWVQLAVADMQAGDELIHKTLSPLARPGPTAQRGAETSAHETLVPAARPTVKQPETEAPAAVPSRNASAPTPWAVEREPAPAQPAARLTLENDGEKDDGMPLKQNEVAGGKPENKQAETGKQRPPAGSQPPLPVEPADVYDPMIFNRQMHPERR